MKTFMMLLILFIASISNTYAQSEKFKALYIYNFTKYINWQTGSRQTSFIIGVLGNSDIVAELKVIAEKRKVNDLEIKVLKFASVNDIKFCHILYVPENKSSQLEFVIPKLEKNMLLITDKVGLLKISGINFISRNNAIGFEINTANLLSKGLTISQEMVKLAANVQ